MLVFELLCPRRQYEIALYLGTQGLELPEFQEFEEIWRVWCKVPFICDVLVEKTLFPSLILAPRMSGIDIRTEMITNRKKFQGN